MFVRSERPYALQTAFLEAYEEAPPAFLAFARALACAEYLPVAVLGTSTETLVISPPQLRFRYMPST